MLKSKAAIFIFLGVLISIAIGLQFIDKQERIIANSIKAVPLDAAVIIETNSFPSLIQKLNSSNVFKNEFSSIPEFSGIFDNIEFLDSLIRSTREINNALSENDFTCSGHLSARNTLDYLFVLSLSDDGSENEIRNFIAEFVNERADIMQRTYEGQSLYDLVFFEEQDIDKSFSYFFAQGLFICSFSKILTEEAIRQLNSEKSLILDKGFSKLSQTSGKNVDANIFFNYRYFPNSLKNVIAPSNSAFFSLANHFASWSMVDLNLKSDAVLLSGYTYADDSTSNYLNAFKGQDNIENDFLDVLPENTSAFVALNIDDADLFRTKYNNYLTEIGAYRRINTDLTALNSNSINVGDIFYDNIEGAISLIYMQNNNPDDNQNFLGIFQHKDNENLISDLGKFEKKKEEGDSVVTSQQVQTIAIDNEENVLAKKFPFPKLFPLLYGKVFNQLDAEFYMIIEDYLIVGKSINLLKQYYKKYKQQLTLAKNKNFELYSNSISSESNIFLYANFPKSKQLLKTNLADKLKNIYSQNPDKFDKLHAVSLQFGVENDFFFTNVYLNYNPAFKKKTNSAWEIQLDTFINTKPQMVTNHYTGNKEVLVQDADNNLILFGTKGKILWKRNLAGKILGEAHQIDFYKNNKLQIILNTKSHIFLIDRNGKDVENYPIKFKSPATNGIAVLDYDGKKNYRIVVACENRSVYLLNKSATKVDGWKFDKTISVVNSPVQYFSNNNKDYLIFADNKNVYILNRRGETRIELKTQFAKAVNSKFFIDKGTNPDNFRFITTNNAGHVYFIYPDGSLKKLTINDISPKHYFSYVDLFGNGKNYLVYTDNSKLMVYNEDKSLRFEKNFKGLLNNSLNFYNFGNNIKYIGVSVASENKIYLYSPKGKIVNGFPMPGSSPFSIGKLNKDEKQSNLLVGGSDGFLFNYSIH
ncbi:MAG: hypothetical protein B6I20_07695 [Bacteroidetes bacterium 4572_117]|nr:MAG: hypothetical protein B6I20_07695 [Bacteroidetes bacterium 4572_117]